MLLLITFPPVGLSPYLPRKSQALDIHSSKADCSIKGTQPPYRFLTEWVNPFKKQKKKTKHKKHTHKKNSSYGKTSATLKRHAQPSPPQKLVIGSSDGEPTLLSSVPNAIGRAPRWKPRLLAFNVMRALELHGVAMVLWLSTPPTPLRVSPRLGGLTGGARHAWS